MNETGEVPVWSDKLPHSFAEFIWWFFKNAPDAIRNLSKKGVEKIFELLSDKYGIEKIVAGSLTASNAIYDFLTWDLNFWNTIWLVLYSIGGGYLIYKFLKFLHDNLPVIGEGGKFEKYMPPEKNKDGGK